MIFDDERREVARRLRELRLNPWDDAACEIVQCVGIACCNSECHGSDETPECTMVLAHRLADLVEPSEPKVRCVAEVKVDGERLEQLAHDAAVELTGIDRDALMEEVKELEKCAWYFGLDFDEDEPLRDRLEEASEAFAGSARRIREALGVADEN